MKRHVANVFLIVLGMLLCVGTQRGLRLHRRLIASGGHGAKSDPAARAIADWRIIDKAVERRDAKAINNVLRVIPGDVELVVSVCPVYPNTFGPIARISLRNVSTRSLTILRPVVKRLTSPSYQHLGRLCDDFSVYWSISECDHLCYRLDPDEVLTLPPVEMGIVGTGLHEVRFTLSAPFYESAQKGEAHSTPIKLGETVASFTIEKPTGHP